ncbi:MAG: TonB-dependent receptor [Chitinophagaceae bacterium]
MRKSYSFLAAWLVTCLFAINANAQSVTVSGTVKNGSTKENVPAVSIRVKGTDQGTYTNSDGIFTLKVAKLPVVLVFTSIGFEDQELTVSDASKPVNIDFKVNTTMGQDVVVAASRSAQRSLDAPVTVERLNRAKLLASAAPTAYEAIGNEKGVDVHTASLTFRTVTTRGFVSSGNTRLNQLIDGMDNQAPGLNFSVSSIVGLSDLDVDNIEILAGASSALYGSGGMNGTVLINSKNPFKYEGFSFNIKQGMMHVDHKQRTAAPYYNWSFRWAKAISTKLAFKIGAELLKGSDWEAEDYRNKQQVGVLSQVVGGNRRSDPNFNGINIYGDETSADMNGFSFYLQDKTRRGILAASGGAIDVVNLLNIYMGAIGNPVYPTNAQLAGFYTFAGFPALLQATLQSPQISTPVNTMLPFYLGLKNNYFNKASISRTGYNEQDLVDYNTLNVKVTGAVHYKISDRIEASISSYFGTGTTVYTGAERYSLRNFKMAQHKAEVKAKHWMVRGYTTQENAGDSYIGGALGAFINESYNPSSNWFPTYIATFSQTRRLNANAGNILSDDSLHRLSRTAVEGGRLVPGTVAFNAAANKIKSTPVNKPFGAKFLDKSDLYAAETQFNVSDIAHFSDKVEIIAGLSWKQWAMNSQGTIFSDTTQVIRVNEYGGYLQLKKKLLKDVLTLSGSVRYDKQTNFKGKLTPRFTAVIRVAKDNNIRLSYQTAYRFPSNQNQFISLRLGGGSSYLIGCLPQFQTYYKLNSTLPGYVASSVFNTDGTGYRNGGIADSARLVKAVYNPVIPETVTSYEIGYKGLIGKKLLLDAYYYYSIYDDFLVNEAVVQSTSGPQFEVYSPFSSNNLSYVKNSTNKVKSYGWALGLEYQLMKKYVLYGNVFSDQLRNLEKGVISFFNAPKYRFNIGLKNENVYRNIGFNVVFKWQDNNYYEGTFVSGTLPYFGWWDGQVTYRPQGSKSTFRVGGTNLGNQYQRTGFGSPSVGGLYYFSYGYNLF